MKLLKYILVTMVGVVLLAIIAVVGLVMFINPNQFKPMLEKQVAQHTGMILDMPGDISWRVWPSIGLTVGETALKTPADAGFSQDTVVKMGQADIDVAVMPLLSQSLVIEQVALKNSQIFIEYLADGRSNLDSLMQSKKETKPEPSKDASSASEGAQNAQNNWQVSLESLRLDNASLTVKDDRKSTTQQLHVTLLHLQQLAFDTWGKAELVLAFQNEQQQLNLRLNSQLKLTKDVAKLALKDIELSLTGRSGDIQLDKLTLNAADFDFSSAHAVTLSGLGQMAQQAFTLNFSTDLEVSPDFQQVALAKPKLDASLQGAEKTTLALSSERAIVVTPKSVQAKALSLMLNDIQGQADVAVNLAHNTPMVTANLVLPKVNLDQLMGKEKAAAPAETTKSPEKPATKKPLSKTEPNLAALSSVNANVALDIGHLIADGIDFKQVKAKATLNNGVLKISQLATQVFDGQVDMTAILDSRQKLPSYQLSGKVVNIETQPMLKQLAKMDWLEGNANLQIKVSGQGLSPYRIVNDAKAQVNGAVLDGAIHGYNVAQMIREAKAKYSGGDVAAAATVQKTDFSELTTSLSLNQAVLTLNSLNMKSPLLRIQGQGKAPINQQTLDMNITATIVGSLKGQGGASLKELKGLPIPIHLYGPWSKVDYKLDYGSLLKAKARDEGQKEIDRFLEKKLGDKPEEQEAARELINQLFK